MQAHHRTRRGGRWNVGPLALALLALPLLAACEAPAPEQGEATVEDGAAEVQEGADQAARATEEEIMELEREWLRRFQQGDTAWIAERHAEQGRMMPPGSEAAVGRDAVRSAWGEMVRTEGLELTFEPSEAHVSEGGDMAYVIGTYDMTLPDGAEDEGKYLVVWVREGGEWRIAADMFNSNRPPAAEGS